MALLVNGETVPQELIDQEVERLRPDYDRLVRQQNQDGGDEQLVDWSTDNVIERVLLRQEAMRRPAPERENAEPSEAGGETGEPDPAVEEQARIGALIDEITSSVPPANDDECRRAYRKHRDAYQAPEQVHAAHIVKHARSPAERDAAYVSILNIKEQLDKGRSFEELACEHSDCPDSAGDLGVFGRGQMVEEFENVVFDMKPGDVSDVFESPFGFHIAKVHDRHPGGVLPFEEIKDRIGARLLDERRTKAIEAFVDQLREQAVIERIEVDAPAEDETPGESDAPAQLR